MNTFDGFAFCPHCLVPHMVPLSDYGRDGAEIRYKAWVCTVCGYAVRIDNGEISLIKPRDPEKEVCCD